MKTRLILIIIIALIIIPGIKAILEIEVSKETIIMPNEEQNISMILQKPTISEPIDLYVRLTINGSATFKDQSKIKELTFEEVNWSGLLLKKLVKSYPLVIINSNKTEEIITINGYLSYYNKMFDYKKTQKSNESVAKTFKVIRTLQDERIQKDYDTLMDEYKALFQDHQETLDKLNKTLSKNSKLKQQNQEIRDSFNDYKVSYYMFQTFRILIILLSLSMIYLLIRKTHHKRRKI